jgi:hypothetical protein
MELKIAKKELEKKLVDKEMEAWLKRGESGETRDEKVIDAEVLELTARNKWFEREIDELNFKLIA